MASPKLPVRENAPKRRQNAPALFIAFVSGTFDLLHDGHRYLLREARSNATQLIVALDSDARAQHRKGPGRPVEDEATRSQNLVATGLVSLVVGVDSDDQLRDAITYYAPDLLVTGIDDSDKAVGVDLVPAFMLVPMLPGHSTTIQIKDRLQ